MVGFNFYTRRPKRVLQPTGAPIASDSAHESHRFCGPIAVAREEVYTYHNKK